VDDAFWDVNDDSTIAVFHSKCRQSQNKRILWKLGLMLDNGMLQSKKENNE
jgi:hypothetical protein